MTSPAAWTRPAGQSWRDALAVRWLRLGPSRTDDRPAAARAQTSSSPSALENGVKIREVPVNDRIRLVEDIRDSIAEEREVLMVSNEQRREFDRRLEAYRLSGDPGVPALEAIERIRTEL